MNVTVNYTHEDLPHVLNKISGKNLLHNADFRNPVNQRGQTSYDSTGYTIDRWKNKFGTGKITVNGGDGGIALAATDNNVFFTQILRKVPMGKMVTLSALTSEGEVFGSSVWDGTDKYPYQDSIFSLMIGGTDNSVSLTALHGNTVVIYAAKLELGSVSTLANDPPADIGEELQKCKRYYRQWTTEAARTEALKEVGLMRLASPTVGTIVIGGVTYYYASADL